MRATLSDAASGRTFAVTNDAARDHHFMHHAPLAFRRWVSRHVLRFEFARRDDDAPCDATAAIAHLEDDVPRAPAGATRRDVAGSFGARGHNSQRDVATHAFVLAEPPLFSTECQRLSTETHDAWLLPIENRKGADVRRGGAWLAISRRRDREGA